jgi:hypothetical protein
LKEFKTRYFFAKEEHTQGLNSVENKGEIEEVKNLKVN